ncbi:MAG: hypothetical protein COU06_01920 [Candidatus Harrisonbacteria bacterium CG10_big_fil_rev_8_21_14_0_10_38_8]|uniref:Oxidized purine nucleoside triphosphate hydrolase n=1 Tax=Candidatus Harrisonbacteria bacterium CG10_big_fil_rev_8_21_14_0_10_38_8 TaxID=1974582 RepID=A0A2M6WJX5_9BACT|nr:MAG: hypothetical protein COU06_01920 [Candidatus Harrisonbacteria bacterium CG10_big_fil_rev_8_21_14_0_10_38_8]
MEKHKQSLKNREKIRDVTLIFLIKRSQGEISEICLAMKKRGFGMNRWNGVGGKVEKEESISNAAKREAVEEIGVQITEVNKVAELSFYFLHKPEWSQKVHVYFSETWNGEPIESDEMRPKWFQAQEIPFNDMWPTDEVWIPDVLSGKLVKATFHIDESDVAQSKDVKVVDSL